MSLWSSVRALFSRDDPVLTFDAPSIDNVISYGDVAGLFPGMGGWDAAGWRIDRRRAMQVGAVARARNLICVTVAGLPAYAMRTGTFERSTRTLLDQPERDVPRVITMVRTIEDLMFEECAWWRVTEREWAPPGQLGYPLHVRRLDPASVDIREEVKVFVRPDGSPQGSAMEEVPDRDLIRFYSTQDGLLSNAGPAIRTLVRLNTAMGNAADSPAPRGAFVPADGVDPAGDDDIKQMLNEWKLARQQGVDAYIPAALNYLKMGWSPAELALPELSNAAVLEMSRFTGLDPVDLAADTGGGSTQTYQNVQDKRRALVDGPLAAYVLAIQDRLSMGDVTPRGTVVRLDVNQYQRADATDRLAEYQVMRELRLIDRAEIRRREELPEPVEPPDEPAAAAEPQLPAAAGRPQLRAVAAAADAPLTFDDAGGQLVLGFASDPVVVDFEKRTIRGLAVPFGVVATKNGRRFRFSRGSIRWTDVGRVKVLIEHVRASALGRAIELSEDDRGLWAVLSIDRTPEGDRALAKAAAGTWDGLSIGLPPPPVSQFSTNGGIDDCVSAPLMEISLTPFPAFDDARVSGVAASADGGEPIMECPTCGTVHAAGTPCPVTAPVTPPAAPAAPAAQTFTAADFDAFQQFMAARQQPEPPEVIRAVPPSVTLSVTEALPYTFDADRGFLTGGEHDFAGDLWASSRNDHAATERVLGFMAEALQFAVTTTNAAALNPSKQRPDLWVEQRQYQYPLWAAVRKESLAEITPLVLPKYSSHSGLVAAHTEGTEPAGGAYAATSQTITPGAMSGKAEITRELYDQSGARIGNLIWQKMTQGWFEALEARVVSTLVAAAASITDITLTALAVNKALSADIAAAVAALQYVRGGYTFDVLATQIDLYTALAKAVSDTGEPLFPQIAPNNRNGSSASKFASMNVHGVDVFPEWALAASGVVAASSWLLDREAVWAAASTPNRLEWNFGATSQTNNLTQIAYVTIGIWGYAACAVLDAAGLREVIYDPA